MNDSRRVHILRTNRGTAKRPRHVTSVDALKGCPLSCRVDDADGSMIVGQSLVVHTIREGLAD